MTRVFDSEPIWEVLNSAEINLVSINAARIQAGLPPVIQDDQALLSGVMMLAAKLAREKVSTTLLIEEHDRLRVKYADVQEANRKIKDKLCHAAKKTADTSVQQLVVQMYAQPRADVLPALPTGTVIARAGRGEV